MRAHSGEEKVPQPIVNEGCPGWQDKFLLSPCLLNRWTTQNQGAARAHEPMCYMCSLHVLARSKFIPQMWAKPPSLGVPKKDV